MTYQEQTRGFHVTSYYVVQKTWTLQQKKTNRKRKDKQLHDSSEDYKDVWGSTLVPPAGATHT